VAVTVVDLETARRARGLRLVVSASVPSPWGEAARGIFHVKGIDTLVVRAQFRDPEARAWTGVHNVPAVLFDDEPTRSNWADILALAERLQPAVPLLPADRDQRVRALGLAHEICSEGGLGWSVRLVLVDLSLRSGGERGFPAGVAQYLAGKYGYAPERIAGARARVSEVLAAIADQLEANRGPYLFSAALTALDIYAATALGVLSPLPDEVCPMLPAVRRMFAPLAELLADQIPPSLLDHRDRMYQQHLPLPALV
jgi:glutathione S-transferase